jgi:hypothetical protein
MKNFVFSEELLERIAETAFPHMKAMDKALEKAIPEHHPDALYIIALGFYLSSLLTRDEDQRQGVAASINSLLVRTGYRLVREQ